MRDFQEACELLNWGLENRRMGRTAMNFTSSRSHTVLTVKVGNALLPCLYPRCTCSPPRGVGVCCVTGCARPFPEL